MGSLDQRGYISIALLIVYPFVFLLALTLTIRHGFTRQAGWLFLMIFSTAKIVGAILHIIAEKQSTPSQSLFVAAYAVEGVGLAPLLECTLSFIGIAGSRIIDTHAIVNRNRLRLLHVLITVGLIMTVIGAIDAGNSSQSKRDKGSTLRKVGGIILLTAFVILTLIHLLFWKCKQELVRYQTTLLKGISFAVPFLAVRVVYTTLSAFSPSSSLSTSAITSGSSSGLAKFNSTSGSWQLFLVMSVLMEFVVISIYIFFGLRLPIGKNVDDDESTTTYSSNATQIPLYPHTAPGYYPQKRVEEGHGPY